MSYEVLARKWRPQTFDEVVGQDHITRTLKKAVESERLSHAYLFSGPRGCGKTSTARILAKVIDCTELDSLVKPHTAESVLNGIAYNYDTGTYFLTGKNWPLIFEVTIP